MAVGELPRRVLVAAVGVPAVLAALYLGGWIFAGLIAVTAMLAAAELYGLASARGIEPFGPAGMAASGAVVLIAAALPTPGAAASAILALLVAVTLGSLAAAAWLRTPAEGLIASVAVTVLGVIYVGCTLAFAVFLRGVAAEAPERGDPGAAVGFVLLPLAATWVGDSAAYFAGRKWGRRRLFPRVSPGKTVVGAVAGLIGSAVTGGAVAGAALSTLPTLPVSVPAGVLIGAVLGLVTPVGDVAESVLKRAAGVKDSGRLLPGHGGVLDRTDALLFAFPVAYGLLMLIGVIR